MLILDGTQMLVLDGIMNAVSVGENGAIGKTGDMNSTELSAKNLAALFNAYFDKMAIVEMENLSLKEEIAEKQKEENERYLIEHR
jgi:hypothetical protein